jgi:hypothetical protein
MIIRVPRSGRRPTCRSRRTTSSDADKDPDLFEVTYVAYSNWTKEMGYTLTQTQQVMTRNLENLGCGGGPGDPMLVTHQRILAHLEERAERILAAEKGRDFSREDPERND